MGGRDASDIMQPSEAREFMNVLGHAEMFDACSARTCSPQSARWCTWGRSRRRHGAVPEARLEGRRTTSAHISNTYNDPTGATAIKWIGREHGPVRVAPARPSPPCTSAARRHSSMKILTASRRHAGHQRARQVRLVLRESHTVHDGRVWRGHPLAKGAERLHTVFVNEIRTWTASSQQGHRATGGQVRGLAGRSKRLERLRG